MPVITNQAIVFLPEDRYLITEQSVGINSAQFAALIASAKEGQVHNLFKFYSEIYEKDSDINSAIQTRSTEILSKEWMAVTEDGEEDEELTKALKDIVGDPTKGMLSTDQLISAMLGESYLTGVSFNEIVADEEGIVGFTHIPSYFLSYYDTLYFPDIYTSTAPNGEKLNNPDKFILHYMDPSLLDKTRGFLGVAVGWQYVLKTQNLKDMLTFQRKYGKPFLVVKMDKTSDGYDKDYKTAQSLVQNLDKVQGVVFSNNVDVDMEGATSLTGDYFFTSAEEYRKNIAKLILGQTSTSDSTDSNRSTADVHSSILDQRVMSDMELIEETLSTQLVPHVLGLLNRSHDGERFKFIISDMEEALDEEIEQEDIPTEETQQTQEITQDEQD